MRKTLHNFVEYQYESLKELREDIVKLKEEGFDIVIGKQKEDTDWRLEVIYTKSNSMNEFGSIYGKHRKYHIFDMYQRVILEGVN